MANVVFAARTAATTALNVVSATAATVNVAVNTIADLATVASLHSSAYLDATKRDIADNADLRAIAGAQEARLSIAERLVSIQDRLNSNEKLAEMYEKVGAELVQLRAKPVAA